MMKKMRKEVLLVLLCAHLLLLPYCAVTYAEESAGIYGIVSENEQLVLTPQTANGRTCAVVETEIGGLQVLDFYPGAEQIEMDYSDNVENGADYLMLVVKGEDAVPVEDNIVYIAQKNGENGTVSFRLFPKELEAGCRYSVLLSGNSQIFTGLLQIASFSYGTASYEGTIFGVPDMVLPDNLTAIEESAFEGVAAAIAYVPDTCTSIGAYAFRNTSLEQIRIPADCSIGTNAFEGCASVMIFGAEGSPAEEYCELHDNCIFVCERNNPSLMG